MDINSMENNIAKANPLLKKGAIAFLAIVALLGTYNVYFDSEDKEVVKAAQTVSSGSVITKGFSLYKGKTETETLCNTLIKYDRVYKSERYDTEKDVCVVEYSTGSYQFLEEYKKYEVLTKQDLKNFLGDDEYKEQIIKEAFGSNMDYRDIYPKKPPYVSPEDIFMSGSKFVSDREGKKLCTGLNTLLKKHFNIVGSEARSNFYSAYDISGIESVADMVNWISYEKTDKIDKNGDPVYERPKYFEFTGARPWSGNNCYVVFTKDGEKPSQSKNNYYSQVIPFKYLGAVTSKIKESLEIREEQYLDNKPYVDSIKRVERKIGVIP